MNCPEGKIRRVGYKAVRSSTNATYTVKPACVKDVGKPGKTPVAKRIVSDDKFDLSIYGYKDITNMKADERRKALKKAMKDVTSSESKDEHASAVKVMRRLNYLSILTKETQPTLSNILKSDRNWIGHEYLGKAYSV